MLEIKCLHCCETLDIPKWVDTDSYIYDGEIVCSKCQARLAITFVGSPKPVKYRLRKNPPKPKKLSLEDIEISIVHKDKKDN